MADSGILDAVIIGCGDIAGGYDEATDRSLILTHAGAYRQHPGFRVTACVDPDPMRRRAFMTYWNVSNGFDELDACLAAGPAPDVVSVCSPTSSHAAALERLLASPVRVVFCEKPMTDDLATAQRLVQAYESAGKRLCVNYLRRWDPAMVTLRTEIESGQWGAVRSVTAFYTKGLCHIGAHMIDLLQFLLGPLSAKTVLRRHVDHTADDPTTDAVLATSEDAPVYLVGGDARDYARFEASIACQNGVIEIIDSGFRIRRRPVNDHRFFPSRAHLDAGATEETGLGTALARAVENLYTAATAAAPLASDGASALASESLCEHLANMPVCGASR
jgi:predicted dehydrogenase